MEEIASHHCKNCSTEIDGAFCHFCGQRYHDHKETFGELVYEFTSDFLHFDSRFFKTVLPLMFLPGKLTISYNAGKQRSQFHPIRLYLFSSFIYFLLFFSFNNIEEQFNGNNKNTPVSVLTDSARFSMQKDSALVMHKYIPGSPIDSSYQSSVNKMFITGDSKKIVTLNDSSKHLKYSLSADIDSLLHKNVTPEQYLAEQKMLPKSKKAGYFKRILTLKLLKINLQGEEGRTEFFKKLTETFFHNIPKMLFFLLPVFALLLKLLYFRRKQFYFVDHAILSLHYFCLIFLLLIFSNFILDNIFGTEFFGKLAVTWIFLYLFIAMKRIYGQSWMKTFGKYILLGFLFSIVVLITILANMAVSALMV